MTDAPVDFVDDVILPAIDTATQATVSRYGRHVHPDGVRLEIYTYAYGPGRKHIAKWLAEGDQLHIDRALRHVGRQYAERQKAARCGYAFEDVAWYSEEKLHGLLEVALDDQWDGLTGDTDADGRGGGAPQEGGTLLAMVADIRAALDASPAERHVLESMDLGSVEYQAALSALSVFLGGCFPAAPGYRRRAG